MAGRTRGRARNRPCCVPHRDGVTIRAGTDEIGVARQAFEAANLAVTPDLAVPMEDL